MFRRKHPFIQKFEALVKEEGFDTSSDFVDDWIANGGTFRTIYDFVLLKGINVDKYTVWLNLRNYLTIGYGGEDAFWYKWDSLAKIRGKDSIVEWMNENRDKLTTMEIAREFGVTLRPIEKLIVRIDKLGNKEVKKYRKRKDSDGFTMTRTKERWLKMLNEKGYKTLREAFTDMINKGLTIEEMAYVFDTTKNTIRRRLKRAEFVLTKRKEVA